MQTIHSFLDDLSSSSPTPGGGGASALVGALSAALLSMVAHLTDGKKKYAAYQQDIQRIIRHTASLKERLERAMLADEEAFLPLSAAYSVPKDDPSRPEKLEQALKTATEAPLELMETLAELTPILEELAEKGSRLAVSDVAVAAAALRSALEGASMNVWINTKMMQDRAAAAAYSQRAEQLLAFHCPRCQAVLDQITTELRA